jgi:lipid A 3-O-deacylase
MNKTTPACLALLLIAAAATPGHAASGPFDELRLGVSAHDVAIGGDSREHGADLNAEILFVSPDLLAPIWAPRPHLGINANVQGKNSYGYFGLTWTGNFFQSFFADLGLGGAIHTGPDESTARDHKGLGTRFLFHESVELGYRFLPGQNVGIYIDHVSNANLGSHNPGITNIGARYGIMF